MSIYSINDLGFLVSCLDLQHLGRLTQHLQFQLAELHNQTIKQLALLVQHNYQSKCYVQIQHEYTYYLCSVAGLQTLSSTSFNNTTKNLTNVT